MLRNLNPETNLAVRYGIGLLASDLCPHPPTAGASQEWMLPGVGTFPARGLRSREA
jgi:hypothetical protein